MGDEAAPVGRRIDKRLKVLPVVSAAVLLLAVLAAVMIWAFRSNPGEVGLPADWFSGLGAFAAVALALWQSVAIQKQARQDADEAAERLQRELDAAEERSVKALQHARELHDIQLAAEREEARVQRVHLREQEFKLALIRVSRAVSSFSHELATLIAETPRIASLKTRDARDEAIKPLAKQRNLASHDLSLEVGGAHMLTNIERIHSSLDPIMEAATDAMTAVNEYEILLVSSAQAMNPIGIYQGMARISEAVGDARRLAGSVLVTGWD